VTVAGPARPRQLPPDASYFTGRAGELARLDRLLHASGDGPPALAVITEAARMTGIGKTALALRWAHRVAARFDGQLFASLRGHASAGPAQPAEILARFLRALGVPAGQVPGDADEAAALYRTLLDGQRLLIVLDNAASSGQVRPLLPGGFGCVVVVTSRSRLPGLVIREGATRIALDPLTPAEAAELLGRLIGTQRADAEPAAVAQLAARCSFAPLALRIAAERAAARPGLPLAQLAADAEAGSERQAWLKRLTADDAPVAAGRPALR
jgi:hypothetical protein